MGEHSPGAVALLRCDDLRHPQVGLLLALVLLQQIAFGGFQQFLVLFTLVCLGMSATGNAVVVGILPVIVQGGLIGRQSRRVGEVRLIRAGLFLLTCSLPLTAFTEFDVSTNVANY